MNKERTIEKYYKRVLKSVDATDEQINYLLTQYVDEKYIIGIYNTELDYSIFFEDGIYDEENQEIEQISNIVMYSENLENLLIYPNGDGKKREKTAIILKIPKKVFSKEQGIIEKLENGRFGIPKEYIIAAFCNGKVIKNNKYDKYYNSEMSLKCKDQMPIEMNKKLEADIFKKAYSKSNTKIFSMIISIFKSNTRNKGILLLSDGRN